MSEGRKKYSKFTLCFDHDDEMKCNISEQKSKNERNLKGRRLKIWILFYNHTKLFVLNDAESLIRDEKIFHFHICKCDIQILYSQLSI